MRARLALTIAALAGLALYAVVSGAAPTIAFTRLGDTEHLTIQFAKGAVSTCTIYQEQKVREDMRESFPDGKYAPRHCWGLDDPQMTRYDDDWAWIDRTGEKWLVYAEIYYMPSGATEPTMAETNRLMVLR